MLKVESELECLVSKKLDAHMRWAIISHKKIDDLEREKKWKEEELRRKYKVLFYSHNGSKYDNQFVFKSKRFQFQSVINANGIISLVLKGGLVEFRDTMRMTGPASSLASLCESFKLDKRYSKTSFPHKFASKEHLEYVGEVPPANQWPDKKIPEEFQQPQAVFNFKEVSISISEA